MAPEELEEAKASLDRVQKFDVARLPREAELGHDFNFKAVVPDVMRVIELFRQFPIEFLGKLPDQQMKKIASSADAFHQVLTEVMEFSAKQENPSNTHTALVRKVERQYQEVFNQIESLIAYGAALQRDVAGLEQQFRAAIQRANDKADELTGQLAASQAEAARMVADVRKMAEQRGVTQQAI